jgi:hypothetical protein
MFTHANRTKIHMGLPSPEGEGSFQPSFSMISSEMS